MKIKKIVFKVIKIKIIITSIIEIISRLFKIDKVKLWAFVDEIQRELYKKGYIDDSLNRHILKDSEVINQRIERDIDSAIVNYEKLEEPEPIHMTNDTILKEVEKNKYTEEQKKIVKDAIYYEKEPDGSQAQDLLGGEMGIRAEWLDNQ